MPLTLIGLLSPRNRTGRRSGERGVTIAIVAISLAAMLLFSALVIDVGQVMLFRRQDQVAADTAVIAGIWNRYDETALQASVLEMLNDNLPRGNFTVADLDTCAAETLPSGWSTYPNSNCLAHNRYYSQLRVRVPLRYVDTAFAKVGGVNELGHTAFAEARYGRSTDVLPFAIPANAGSHQCLKTGTSSLPDSLCDQSQQGNFGDLEFLAWGNPEKGTAQKCQHTNDTFAINIAQGLDHDLSIFPNSTLSSYDGSGVEEDPSCGIFSRRPNVTKTGNGNTPNIVGKGVYSGTSADFADGKPARLQRLSTLSWMNSMNTKLGGKIVDDVPLWEFIPASLDSSSSDIPRSCEKRNFIGDAGGLNTDNDLFMTNVPNQVAMYLLDPLNGFTAGDRTRILMERCIQHHQGIEWDDYGNFTGNDTHWNNGGSRAMGCSTSLCTDPVFTRDSGQEAINIVDIQASPRFAYVPQLHTFTDLSDAKVAFARFKPVYINRVYASPNIFDPGVGFGPHNGNTKKAEAVTAFVIPDGMLPNGLGDPDAAIAAGKNGFVELTR